MANPLSSAPTTNTADTCSPCAGVAQLVRVPACHAGGRGFEPRHSRHLFQGVSYRPLKSFNSHFPESFNFLYSFVRQATSALDSWLAASCSPSMDHRQVVIAGDRADLGENPAAEALHHSMDSAMSAQEVLIRRADVLFFRLTRTVFEEF